MTMSEEEKAAMRKEIYEQIDQLYRLNAKFDTIIVRKGTPVWDLIHSEEWQKMIEDAYATSDKERVTGAVTAFLVAVWQETGAQQVYRPDHSLLDDETIAPSV